MEGKERKEKAGFNAPLVIGVVGHCPVEKLSQLKEFLETLEGFEVIFFKVGSGKLWIKEEEDPWNAEVSNGNR